MDYELDTPSTSDEIDACGNLTLNGQQFSDFNFTWSANFGPGNYDLIDFGSSSGSLGTNTSGTIDGYAGNAGRPRQRSGAERRAGTVDLDAAWGWRLGADRLGVATASVASTVRKRPGPDLSSRACYGSM